MTELIARLSEESERLEKQQRELKASGSGISPDSLRYSDTSPVGSVGVTPETENFATTPKTEDGSNDSLKGSDDEEIARLRKELNDANSKLAKMDQELAQTRITKHTLEQAMGAPSDFNAPGNGHVREPFESGLHGPLTASAGSKLARTENWMAQQDDARSDVTDPLGAAGIPLNNQLWNKPGLGTNLPKPVDQQFPLFLDQQQTAPAPARPWNDRNIAQDSSLPQFVPALHAQRSMNFRTDKFGGNNFNVSEPPVFGGGQTLRKPNPDSSRLGSGFGSATIAGGWGPAPTHVNWNGKIDSNPFTTDPSQSAYPHVPSFLPRPIGTRLSPTASEFNAGNMTSTPWNAGVISKPFFFFSYIC